MLEQPDRNKIVLERNGKLANLLSVSEARTLRNRMKACGITVTSDRFPILDWDIPEVVTSFTIGTNVYRLYSL